MFHSIKSYFLSSGERGIWPWRRKDIQDKHISGMLVLNTGNVLPSLEQNRYSLIFLLSRKASNTIFYAFHFTSNNSKMCTTALIQVHFSDNQWKNKKINKTYRLVFITHKPWMMLYLQLDWCSSLRGYNVHSWQNFANWPQIHCSNNPQFIYNQHKHACALSL